MRIEDILATTGTGLLRWDNVTGMSTLDATAARLFGLPPEEVTLPEEVLRARINTFDYAELSSVAALAVTEGTIAEATLRIVAEDGTVVRHVRLRLALADQSVGAEPELSDFVLHGLMVETAPPHTPAGAEPGGPEDLAETPVVRSPATQTPVTGDLRRSREAFLLEAGQALAATQTTTEVLRVVGELSMPGFSPSGLVVFGVKGDRLTPIGAYGPRSSVERLFEDIPLASDYPGTVVVRTGRALYLASPEEYRRRFPAAWSLVEPYGNRAWAYLPLLVGGRTIGSWLVAFREPVHFTPDERYVLSAVARMLAQALSRVYVQESMRELADSLQRTMRPAHRPDIPGMAVASRYMPAGGGLQVGGDWYDVIPLPCGRTALVIGDVQGHDVRAAGVMAQLRIALRAYASEGHRPDAVLSRASRFLAGVEADEPQRAEDDAKTSLDDHRFATCLYVEADPATGALDIARAGHPDPVVRMPDGAVLTPTVTAGPPLGVEPDTDYPITRLVLGRGETLLMCTDGLIEAGGLDYETGLERLRAALGSHREDSLEKLADTLIRTMHGPPRRHMTGTGAGRGARAGGYEDDIALLLLSRDGGAPVRWRAPSRRIVLSVGQDEPARVADARHQLRELLYDWAVEDQVEGAVLLLSELLTNALVHTEGDAVVVAELTGEHGSRRLRLEVADRSDELPHRRHPGELASRGRGLLLLEMVAHRWGVDPRGEGKSIWFELHEDAEAAWGD
ncbi:MAG TPA: SpoIIE family protein phosphatase [Streptomyces sp.]|uniref:SpoIIE family protein phosphatase n=1 Tax=Streptomyces sp. TaxID=1931 RepID=UPI002D6A5882|nr:SpoIIE family protein phosphatase [Streptomyces sp.]HZG03228.1 SpoIIE family protein phosphatase [Streptomyces sp.]